MSSKLSPKEEEVFTLRSADSILRFGLFGVLSLGAAVAMPFLEIPSAVLVYQIVFLGVLSMFFFYMLAKCLNERVVVRSGELTHFDWLGREIARFSLSEIERVERGFRTRVVTYRGESKFNLGLMPRGRELLELLVRKGDSSTPLTEIMASDIDLGETVVYRDKRFARLTKPLFIVLPILFIVLVLTVLFAGLPPELLSTVVPFMAIFLGVQGLMIFGLLTMIKKRSITVGPNEVVIESPMKRPKRIPLNTVLNILKKRTDQGYYLSLETTEGEVRMLPLGEGDLILAHINALVASRSEA